MSMGGSMPGMMFGGHPGMSGMGSGGGFGGFPQQQSRRRAGAAAAAPRSYDSIPSDTVVSLKGLVSQPERNGDRGVVLQYNPQNGRYVVLEDTDETMSVKPSNLLQHVKVRLYGIESKPEFNGKTGTIIAWSQQKERYSIYVSSLRKPVSLRPTNVVLNNGTVGMIQGLQSKPELNGKWGTIKEWIRDAGRYNVQISQSSIIKIKLENIRV